MGAEDEDAAQQALGEQTVSDAGAIAGVGVDEAEVAAAQEQAPSLRGDAARPSGPPRRTPSMPGAYSVVPGTNTVSRRSSFNGSSSGRRDGDGNDDDEVDSWDEAQGLAPPVLRQQEDVWEAGSRSFDNDDSDEEEGRSNFGGNGEAGDHASVEHSAVVSTVYVVDDNVTHGTVVVEDEHDDNAAAREQVNDANIESTNEADGRERSKNQRHLRRSMVAAVVALVAVGAVLGVLGGTGHLGGGDGAQEDPSNGSDEPTSRYEALRSIIVSNSVSDASLLDDPTTPQSKALRWLSFEDGARLSPTIGSDRIVQRYVVAVVYFSTDGPHWYDSCKFLTEKHECDWHYLLNPQEPESYKGLHCKSTLDSSVTHVHMYWNNLTGTLPTELGSLETLFGISFLINNLKGTIPSEWGSLPRLQMLLLNNNFLTGQIPTELGQLRYLRSFAAYVNPDLTGNIDFMCPLVEDLPGNLRYTAVNCGGITPEIECSCCSHCCDQETKFCCSREDGSCWDSTPTSGWF